MSCPTLSSAWRPFGTYLTMSSQRMLKVRIRSSNHKQIKKISRSMQRLRLRLHWQSNKQRKLSSAQEAALARSSKSPKCSSRMLPTCSRMLPSKSENHQLSSKTWQSRRRHKRNSKRTRTEETLASSVKRMHLARTKTNRIDPARPTDKSNASVTSMKKSIPVSKAS